MEYTKYLVGVLVFISLLRTGWELLGWLAWFFGEETDNSTMQDGVK